MQCLTATGKRSCRSCELGLGLALILLLGAGLWASGATRNLPRPVYSGPVTALPAQEGCGLCHKMDRDFSHPIGMVPSMSVPSYLPLSNGRMACGTCHENGTEAGHGKSARGVALRGDMPAELLCATCHTGSSYRSMHSRIAKAHVRTARSTSQSNLMAGGIDELSLSCLGCHDGSIAKDSTPASGNDLFSHASSHPIGRRYQASGTINQSDTMLRPSATLDVRIQLYGGTVGCGSCHSPYSQHESRLVMSNDRSKLCLSCHAM